MKIVYIYLCGPFSDGWNYQENLLPKAYKRIGNDVTIITSSFSLDREGKDVFVGSSTYVDENGLLIVRLPLKSGKIRSKLKRYNSVYETLKKENPDFIFLHGCQFLDAKIVARYAAEKNVKMVADNHADFGNSGKGFVSKNILHGVLWKSVAKKLIPVSSKFYGANKARVDFWHDVYGVPTEKTELLLMGADELSVKRASKVNIRSEFGLLDDDFVLVTGGKFDESRSRVLDVMNAVKLSRNEKIKLVVFGPAETQFEAKIKNIADGNKVMYIGWQEPEKSYELFSMANIGVFPCLHSVFWEQAAGLSRPLIVNKIPGMTHVDMGGNVRFIEKESVTELTKIIEDCARPEVYKNMLQVAEKVHENFLYGEIAERSIN